MESSFKTWDFSAALDALSAPTILHNETSSDPTSQPPRSPNLENSGEGVRANAPPLLNHPEVAVDPKDDLSEPASPCRNLGTTRERKLRRGLTRWGLLAKTPSEIKLSSTSDSYAEEKAQTGEERRRKIMQDMSEKPSTPVHKRRNDMEAHSKLVPSSIGVQKSKQVTKESSVLLQRDISDSVKKIAGVISLLSQRFPGYSLPLRAYSLRPDHTVDHGGIHVFVDISNVGSSRR